MRNSFLVCVSSQLEYLSFKHSLGMFLICLFSDSRNRKQIKHIDHTYLLSRHDQPVGAVPFEHRVMMGMHVQWVKNTILSVYVREVHRLLVEHHVALVTSVMGMVIVWIVSMMVAAVIIRIPVMVMVIILNEFVMVLTNANQVLNDVLLNVVRQIAGQGRAVVILPVRVFQV